MHSPPWLESATAFGASLVLAMAACAGKAPGTGARDGSADGGRGGAAGVADTAGAAGLGGTGGSSNPTDGGMDLPATVGGSGGSTPSDAAPPLDQMPDVSGATRADQVCRDAIVAQCERLKVCQGSSLDCEQYAADRCPGYYFGPHTLRTVESVEACIPLIRQASCTDFIMGTATQCLLGGLGAAGVPCSGPGECASNSCFGSFPYCGTCAASFALGESCAVGSGHCVSGTICHPRTEVCVPTPLVVAHAAEGEPCDLDGDPLVGCEGDLMCVPAEIVGPGKCTPLPKEGERCLTVSSLPQCAPGLSCGLSTVGSVRAYLCGNPPPCGTTFCDANSFCYESPTVPIDCQPYVGLDEACSTADDSNRICGPGYRCAVASSFDDGGRVHDGTCVVQSDPVELGGACDSNLKCRAALVCQAGRCARFDPATCYDLADAGK